MSTCQGRPSQDCIAEAHAACKPPAIILFCCKLYAHPALLVDDSSAAYSGLHIEAEPHTEAERCLPRRVSMGAVLEVIEVLAREYTVLK